MLFFVHTRSEPDTFQDVLRRRGPLCSAGEEFQALGGIATRTGFERIQLDTFQHGRNLYGPCCSRLNTRWLLERFIVVCMTGTRFENSADDKYYLS